MEKLFSSKYCVGSILRDLYGVETNQRVCGGCRFCRNRGHEPVLCPLLYVPESVFISEDPKSSIIEDWPDPTQLSQKDDFVDKIEDCLCKYSLKPFHLYCPRDYFEEVLFLIKDIFVQYRGLYRIDPFNEVTVLRSYDDRPKLFLHFGAYNEDMFKKAQKCNSYHLFCGIQNAYEPNGRHIMIKYNCDSWTSPEDWLHQLN